MDEVRQSKGEVILFIDEMHTVVERAQLKEPSMPATC